MRRLAVALALMLAPAAQAARPVVDLDAHPERCMRLDRAVVYVGTPGADARCPAHVIGRRRAVDRTRRRRSAAPVQPVTRAGTVVDGLGFDACTAPSSTTMAAWRGASPYRSIGVYVGGINRGCAQPNLTAAWVAQQAGTGWSFIPTYVGLQAPGSSCGCALINTRRAAAQGAEAAEDAVAAAAAVGFGTGSPLYFDMEAYAPSRNATRAVLAFVDAWTERLHELGYVSGVYSSGASGIRDIVEATNITAPDDLWVANWNNRATVDDPYLPDDRWVGHRIHQYRGGHAETWGGATINIDSNVLDGDVALPGEGVFPYGMPPAAAQCRVPKLVGKRLGKARSLLRRRGCRLGYVRRQGGGRRKVARQQYRAGSVRPARARVGLTLR